MKSNIFICLMWVLINPSAYAQPILSEQLISDKLIRMPLSEEALSRDYEGSPYLKDSFTLGHVMMNPAGSFALSMRYNIFLDLLEVKHKGRDMQILPNELIHEIVLDGYKLVSANYEYNHKKVEGFLFLLDSGTVSLLQKKNVSFEPWRPAKAQEAGPKPATFKESKEQYFVKSIGGKIIEFHSIKELVEILTSHRKEAYQFLEDNKIKMKQEKLIQFFQYYNDLLM